MPQEQIAHINGSGNILVQADGSTVNINTPHLVLTPPAARIPQRTPQNELDLLNPYQRAIPLIGRDKDLKDLSEWLNSNTPIAVRTITGRAGAGKTRFAIELIEKLSKEAPGKWDAGFVSGRELDRFSTQKNLSQWGWQKPALIIVDYAAPLVTLLKTWITELADKQTNKDTKPLRIILLERVADIKEGWLSTLLNTGWSNARVSELFNPVNPLELQKLKASDHKRAVLSSMLDKCSELSQTPKLSLPAIGKNHQFDKNLENLIWEDPLYLMMAAIVSFQGKITDVLTFSRTDLAYKVADLEINRLKKFATDDDDAHTLFLHISAIAVMMGGLSQPAALKIADQESQALVLDYPGGIGKLVNDLHTALPAPDHGIAPIIPDIVAEAFVLRILSNEPHNQQQETMLRIIQYSKGSSAIPILIRMIQDFCSNGCEIPLLWLEVFIQYSADDDLYLLLEIESNLPYDTTVLREKAVYITQLLVEHFAKAAKDNDPNIQKVYARLLNNLSLRLSDLGQRNEALETAQEALQIRKKLAQTNPDAFLPDLAMSLNTLSIQLSKLGQRNKALETAQDALTFYRKLAQANPDAFLPHLAMSLNNLAAMLSDLGQRNKALETAQEALTIYRKLAQTNSDAFLPDLAMSLNNLATMLRDLGQRNEALETAQETLTIYRKLAQANPDAFLPDLAMSLNNLATMLSDLGQRNEALETAQEAFTIYRKLAQANPDAFLPDLAMSLNTLANRLSDLGQRNEALETAQEALQIRKKLAQTNPDAFLPDLARSYGTQGVVFLNLENIPEAIQSFHEGIRLLSPYFLNSPESFTSLMMPLCEYYMKVLEQAKTKPDIELLIPILEILKKQTPPSKEE